MARSDMPSFLASGLRSITPRSAPSIQPSSCVMVAVAASLLLCCSSACLACVVEHVHRRRRRLLNSDVHSIHPSVLPIHAQRSDEHSCGHRQGWLRRCAVLLSSSAGVAAG